MKSVKRECLEISHKRAHHSLRHAMNKVRPSKLALAAAGLLLLLLISLLLPPIETEAKAEPTSIKTGVNRVDHPVR